MWQSWGEDGKGRPFSGVTDELRLEGITRCRMGQFGGRAEGTASTNVLGWEGHGVWEDQMEGLGGCSLERRG